MQFFVEMSRCIARAEWPVHEVPLGYQRQKELLGLSILPRAGFWRHGIIQFVHFSEYCVCKLGQASIEPLLPTNHVVSRRGQHTCRLLLSRLHFTVSDLVQQGLGVSVCHRRYAAVILLGWPAVVCDLRQA